VYVRVQRDFVALYRCIDQTTSTKAKAIEMVYYLWQVSPANTNQLLPITKAY